MVVLTSFPPPEEGIRHQQDATEAHVGSRNYGVGTLFIAQSRVSWRGDSGLGFSLEYPAISLHAVSRDVANFPKECLYLMIDGIIDDRPADQEEDDGEDAEEESAAYTEVRFAPSQTNTLEPMYAAMCECQALHPDDQESMSDDEEGGDGDCFEDAEGELTAQGRATLQHLENIFIGDGPNPTNGTTNSEEMDADEPGQFADAEN